MRDIHTAIAKAELFCRIARFHRDVPRPDRLEQARREAIEALEKMGEGR
jgi:hypothetical protein